jgi:hypothetical protein
MGPRTTSGIGGWNGAVSFFAVLAVDSATTVRQAAVSTSHIHSHSHSMGHFVAVNSDDAISKGMGSQFCGKIHPHGRA